MERWKGYQLNLIRLFVVVRTTQDQFFDMKHGGCIARAKVHTLKNKEIKAVQWVHMAEAQHGNKTIIRSLTDLDGH